jgi:hypothetical protein
MLRKKQQSGQLMGVRIVGRVMVHRTDELSSPILGF